MLQRLREQFLGHKHGDAPRSPHRNPSAVSAADSYNGSATTTMTTTTRLQRRSALPYHSSQERVSTTDASSRMRACGEARDVLVCDDPSSCADEVLSTVTTDRELLEEMATLDTFRALLAHDPVDLAALRARTWHGCPAALRYEVWMYLVGRWHPARANREGAVLRKRHEYVQHLQNNYSLLNWDAVCDAVDADSLAAGRARRPCAPSSATREDAVAQGAGAAPTASCRDQGAGDGGGVSRACAMLARSPVTLPVVIDDGVILADGDTDDAGREVAGRSGAVVIGDESLRATHVPSDDGGAQRASAGPSCPLRISVMLTTQERRMLTQIRKDVPRTAGGKPYLLHRRVQRLMERVLFVWSLRHPACGYVQGMNDVIVPFVATILAHRLCPTHTVAELESTPAASLDVALSETAIAEMVWVAEVEAEVYWMASYLLSAMQDNYTHSQAGILAMMDKLAAVLQAADGALHDHLVHTLGVDMRQFAYRWMNCLLLREFSLTQALRLFDAYLCDETRDWTSFHVYVCTALLLRWSRTLVQECDFCRALHFLQNLPTESFTLRSMDELLAEAFLLQKLYDHALPGHKEAIP